MRLLSVEMESFLITVNKRVLFVTSGLSDIGKIIYYVSLDGYELVIEGNPKWDEGESFLIAREIPEGIDTSLVEEIASAIEKRLL